MYLAKRNVHPVYKVCKVQWFYVETREKKLTSIKSKARKLFYAVIEGVPRNMTVSTYEDDLIIVFATFSRQPSFTCMILRCMICRGA